MHEDCQHFVIRGRVQGVCFRVSAQDRARELGLAGWVRNLSNGDVEAIAAGPTVALSNFQQWLGQGPAGAEVKEVVTSHVDTSSLENSLPLPFEIHRTH